MIVISHAICSYLLALKVKARFVHPRNVRVYFNISKNNYKKNKKASIDLLPKLLSPTQIDQANIERFAKRDDCAEAIILAFYGAKNYGLFDNIQDVTVKRSASCGSRTSCSGKSSSSVRLTNKRKSTKKQKLSSSSSSSSRNSRAAKKRQRTKK